MILMSPAISLFLLSLYFSPSALLSCYDSKVFLLSGQEEQGCDHGREEKGLETDRNIYKKKEEDMLCKCVLLFVVRRDSYK